MLTLKSRDEIAKMDPEKVADAAFDYLGYENESDEDESSVEHSQPRASL